MENAEAEERIQRQLAAALKSEPETWTPACLEPERMLALAERALPESEAAPLMAHVALCARCRREYAETMELMQLAQEVGDLQAQAETPAAGSEPSRTLQSENAVQAAGTQKTPRRPFWRQWFAPGFGFALGAAAAGIALFFAWTLPARVQRDKSASLLMERGVQIARLDQEKKALGQELTALKQQGQGHTSQLEKEIDRLNARMKTQDSRMTALAEAEDTLRQMPLPTAAWKLPQESEQVRGGSKPDTRAPEIALLSPVDTAVQDTRPTLTCRPAPGATAYRVSLEGANAEEEMPILRSLSKTQWKPATPLQPGKVYRWAVTAKRGGDILHSSFGTFYVLSAAQRRELEAARRKYARSPLTLGVIYARLGMPAEAKQQFRAALKGNASASVAKRWLGELPQ